jgi:hypothetical protein
MTHQSQPISSKQVQNHAGGFVFKIDDMARLRRFLILGAEGPHYYTTENQMRLETAQCVLRLAKAEPASEGAEAPGLEAVREIVTVSMEGRAAKQSPALYALAICARLGSLEVRRAALAALPDVARTASTLFEFVNYCKELGGQDLEALAAGSEDGASASTSAAGEQRGAPARRGGRGGRGGRGAGRPAVDPDAAVAAAAKPKGKSSWGRAMRSAVAQWYLGMKPKDLAYQVTKYGSRHGFAHRDLLRLAHPDVAKASKVQEARQERMKARRAASRGAAAGAEAAAEVEDVEMAEDFVVV